MIRAIVTGLACALLTGGIGFLLIPVLRALKAGQSIREEGPIWHNYKAGTPMMGGLIAYLFYNWHPAKVFMGDTGSLFLGGIVCGLAFALNMPLILIPVGFVYICETLSVILQVFYFKVTHGKRLFKMSPIHHHFEMCGWKEVKIVLIFTAVSALMCILAWFGISGRF